MSITCLECRALRQRISDLEARVAHLKAMAEKLAVELRDAKMPKPSAREINNAAVRAALDKRS